MVWLSGPGIIPQTEGLQVQLQVGGTGLGFGPGPPLVRQPHVSLPLFLLPVFLKINKILKKKKQPCNILE